MIYEAKFGQPVTYTLWLLQLFWQNWLNICAMWFGSILACVFAVLYIWETGIQSSNAFIAFYCITV